MKLKVDVAGKIRHHTFAEVEFEGKTILIDQTEFRKTRTMDSVPLYRQDGDTAVPLGPCIRAGRLRNAGIY